MKQRVICDTGPLVAFFNRQDRHHEWAVAQWDRIEPPLLTCEAVVSEACFLLQTTSGGSAGVLELVRRGVVNLAFTFSDNVDPVATLMKKYAGVPMSFADACLVRMTELYDTSAMITLDSDFTFYRKHIRRAIPLLMPPSRGL